MTPTKNPNTKATSKVIIVFIFMSSTINRDMLSFKQYMKQIDEVATTPTTGVTGASKADPTSILVSTLAKDKIIQDALARGDTAGAKRRSDLLVQSTQAAKGAAERIRRQMDILAATSIKRLPQLLGAATR